jgi:hypothetical protein
MQLSRAALTCTTLVLGLTLACSGGRSPIGPSPATTGGTGANPDGSTLKIDAPALHSPANGIQFEDEAPPVLEFSNVQGKYADFPVTYELEIRELTGDLLTLRPTVTSDGGVTTTYTVADALDADTEHQWRVRATYNGAVGPWSAARTFRTRLPEPSEIPCIFSSPLDVVICERNKFGFMSSGELVAFLRNLARSLNASGIEDGPFGILSKTGGNNCDGYSCDIICSGQGNDQKQWDVLLDIDERQQATFSGPEEVPHIRVDSCEIQ